MKLTKEECEKSLYIIAHDRRIVPMMIKSEKILQQLIDEHFESSECRVESSLTREKNLVSNLVSEIDKLEKALDKASEVGTNVYEKAIFRIDYVAELLKISTTSVQEIKGKLKIENFIYYNDFLRIKKLAEEIKSKYKKVALSTINDFIESYGIENF